MASTSSLPLVAAAGRAAGGEVDLHQIRRATRKSRRMDNMTALLLALPLLVFMTVFFILPIGGILKESATDPVVPQNLPRTSALLADLPWDALPDEPLVSTLGSELLEADKNGTVGVIARRLNTDLSGFRSLVTKTVSGIVPDAPLTLSNLVEIDKRWSDAKYWSALKRASATPSSYYLLAALDLKRDETGDIVKQPDHLATFLPVLLRTLVISIVVTAISVAVAIPLSYFIVTLVSQRRAAVALFFVMLPFWTSALVRITGWTVLLQKDGIVNQSIQYIAPGTQPLEMLYTNLSMYLGLIHLMLPFMLVPIYAAMRQVDPMTTKAALSLGARPLPAFLRVFLPQCARGIGSGCAIVFILTLGTYTTPVLLGGAGQQMLSYFISFYTNQQLNWNMAAALSVVLLVMTLIACLLGARFFVKGGAR
jgi:putative spermidine/putrescine transport system permease protein